MSPPYKKHTYVYNSPHKATQDEQISSKTIHILVINSQNDKFPFKNGNYDLAMTLLGEGKLGLT